MGGGLIDFRRESCGSCRRRGGLRWRDGWLIVVVEGFLVGVPFVSEIHYGFFVAEACGLEQFESDGEGWFSSWHGERPPFGGKNAADPLCGFSL
jgi:hypothetical protein